MTKGKLLYDFFVIPTIRIDTRNRDFTRITIEWLKWYIGFVVNKE
jgi:hypothetical protein